MPTNQKQASIAKQASLQRFASYASLCVASILVATKVWAWSQTQSVSILSSLVDSLLDVMASGITVAAVYYSLRPADSEHRFGHGKSEGLAALLQSFIVSLSAFYVWYEAVQRLSAPLPVTNPTSGISVMLLSVTLTLILLSIQRYVVKQTGSLAIAADSMHYRADLAVNLSVILAVVVASWADLPWFDPAVGFAIAAYILWSTVEIAGSAADVLLDRELPESERERIHEIAMANPNVYGFHDLRTRSGGSMYFIQFHLEMNKDTTLLAAHRIMDSVEDDIRAVFPRCEIIIHTDPLGFEERRDTFD
jgi:ferrous-iron efflux pump FieF